MFDGARLESQNPQTFQKQITDSIPSHNGYSWQQGSTFHTNSAAFSPMASPNNGGTYFSNG